MNKKQSNFLPLLSHSPARAILVFSTNYFITTIDGIIFTTKKNNRMFYLAPIIFDRKFGENS